MEDEDEIDVLGEFNLENLLTKNEDQISSCYDSEHHLGLHCDSPWMLDTPTQACWYDTKSDPQSSFGGFPAINSFDSYDTNTWTDKERYLLEKGLELFGRSWSRLAQYIGTKTSSQVKSYMKAMGVGWTGKSSVSASSFSVENTDFNFTELIDDMEIPASMEEVIAAVSTAQPTIIVPSSQREVNTAPNISSNRKMKGRRKKISSAGCKSNKIISTKSKEIAQIYNAEDIKGVLTDFKEKDSIVLPNGEQVIRMRHGSVTEESDVEIDIDSDVESSKINLAVVENHPGEENLHSFKENIMKLPTKAEDEVKDEQSQFNDGTSLEIPENKDHTTLELIPDNIGKEVSVFTDNFIENKHKMDSIKKETQIFKGNLVTPSGKMMTVVVDNMPSSYTLGSHKNDKPMQNAVTKYMSSIQERLDAVYQLPPPAQELTAEPYLVTQEEKLFHPEFFSKPRQGVNRYIKIRNHIIECWKNSKPIYVTKTSVRAGLKNCGDVNLISRIHAYLEQKGYINFGCEQCHYNSKLNTSCDVIPDKPFDQGFAKNNNTVEPSIKCPGNTLGLEMVAKRESCRARKKKLPFEELCEINNKGLASRNTDVQGIQNVKSRKLERCGISSSWKARKRKIFNTECAGGYTMVHTESGDVIVQHSQPASTKISTRKIKPIKLIHCKNYSANNKAPYRVELEVTALLLVDIHSHMSPKYEVIGLLGGLYRSSDNVLIITTAVPCRTVLSSNIHCDMCPVSQCESSELITNRGLSVVGWYHSHPNFDPSPSDTDVDTQNTLQSWFNETGKPFVGLIISPYYPVHSVSTYRCCQVKIESSGPVPYQLEVKLRNYDDSRVTSLRQSIQEAYNTLQKNEPIKQLHIYKCLESIKHHLRRASPKVEEELMSEMIQQIRDFFKEISVKSSLIT